MRAAFAAAIAPDDPLSGLVIGERPQPEPPPGWARVRVQAASLNHHDLWSLRGIGLSAERLPMILGCDAAGVAEDGREVIVHAVIDEPGGRSLLSERHPGTFAEQVAVPAANLVDKPPQLSWEQAACLPTAWLTAYRMLFDRSGVKPGGTVLVQGAGGGVATAAVALGAAAGYRVWVTSRSPAKRELALSLGADHAFEPGARLPERVEAVLETVGAATWGHSLRAVRPGGTIVVAGATSGADPAADLRRVFYQEIAILGTTMGSRDDLARLAEFCVRTGVRPLIDSVLPLADAAVAFRKMADGELRGKLVLSLA